MNNLPKTEQNTAKKLPRCCTVQYRSINIKTTSKEGLEMMSRACLEKPNSRLAWVEHPDEGETPVHYHLAASFPAPVRLREALEQLCVIDPHCYIKPCRNFRASVRYLAHLDNPEKHKIDPSGIILAGDWEGVNLPTLFEQRGASASLHQIVEYLQEWVREEGAATWTPVQFALWLDSHGYSSAKAFSRVRSMGLSWHDLLTVATSREESHAPCSTTPQGDSSSAAAAG